MRIAWSSFSPLFPLAALVATVACSAGRDPSVGPTDAAAGSPDTGSGFDFEAGLGSDALPEGGGSTECKDVVDVVFVLDVSSSMDFVLDRLGREIDGVVAAATKLAPDPHFGFVGYVDNHRLDTRGALEGGKVHVDGKTLRAAFDDFKKTYTNNNRNPGDGPTGPTTQNPICEENSLDALAGAAREFPWRTNATRIVILATDGDRDGDGKTDKKDYPREGDYPAKVGYLDTIEALRAARVRVFSFTRLKEPGPLDLLGRCGTGRRLAWSQIAEGWSQPYKGKAAAPKGDPIPKATAGKNYDLELVRSGKLPLSETINEVVIDSYCNPPVY
jgi:hypothetical protein